MQKFCLFCFLLGPFAAAAQKIEGTVKDDQGNILPFASILVKGTNVGVATNNTGVYSLSLSPGKYSLECRYVGYSTVTKQVTVGTEDLQINFILPPQKLTLKEIVVNKNGEDPAYEIIRQAIKKRPFYDEQVETYRAQVYVKGMIRLRDMPDRFIGKKIEEADKKESGIDSTGKGIIYLSESVTQIAARKPGKFKLEVLSSRVSGSNGLGFDFPLIVSFYKNNVMLAPQLNRRGFVSPIADGAMNFYRYKFLGTFFENGRQVNVIEVTPRREFEPLFSGIINIVEDDWRIYSCNLLLTRRSQLQLVDSLSISQIHMPVSSEVWRVKSQVVHFSFDQFGFKAAGDFLNVYDKYELEPEFEKNYFDRVVIAYDTAVNKKTSDYWDTIRPVPLEPDEIKDYRFKDSVLKTRSDPSLQNIDSLRKKEGPVTFRQIMWSGVNHTHYKTVQNKSRLQFDPLLKTLQYNTVEGVAINPSMVISKRLTNTNSRLSLITDVRYGFNNGHLNPWAGIVVNTGDTTNIFSEWNRQRFFVAGGKRVSQFFKESQVSGLGNTIGTLLYGRNNMKVYENYFAKAGYQKEWESSASLLIEAGYEDRLPLNNTTDFILNKKWLHRFTPNYPAEILSDQFDRHQSVAVHMRFRFKPGQRYIQFPKYKMAIGSKYPWFTLDYTKGLHGLFGSDVDYDKWRIEIENEFNMKLAGSIRYRLSAGGFLNSRHVFAQDYHHFYANISHVAKEYVQSFQDISYYALSNTSPFFTALHLEHHSNGLITNKIPLFRKLNWTLVEGLNAIQIQDGKRHAEIFVGLENIFKIFRIDAVMSLENNFAPNYTYRVGFNGLLGDIINQQRFAHRKKIIDVW